MPNTPPVGVGIRIDNSLFNRVRDVVIWDFEVGIDLNLGASNTYSAYNVIERFEISRCRTGIRLRDQNGGNTIQNGRIWAAVVGYDNTAPGGAREEGIGIDIEGTYSGQPIGARGLVISGLTIESTVIGLRIVSSRDIAVLGCYFAPGDPHQYPVGTFPYGRTRRRTLEIDDRTEALTFVGSQFSAPNVPPGEENWTPTYIAIPPEARGEIDARSFPHTNTYLVNGLGAGLSGTTAAHANKIKNADFSRGAMFWSVSASPPTVTPTTSTFITGGASVLLRAHATSTTAHIYQDFVIDSGVRTVTVNVRYSLRSSGAHAFRCDLWDVASSTRLGFFSDVGPGPAAWRIRSLTGRFDGLAGGVTGPRTLRVRVYPYNGDPMNLASQQIYIDSVWLVEGEYAASYRPYGEAVEVVAGDDRQVFFSGTNVGAPVGPVSAAPSSVPSNAIAMVVEMMVAGSTATANPTILRVNDGTGTDPVRDLHAQVDARPVITEYTLPFAAASPPQWSIVGASPLNLVTYAVRLKKWILRS